jgi:predicted Fe-Mo cluster-binding NifX family protein
VKIAIPIEDTRGLESPVYGHFGSAPAFVVVDSESGAASVIDNRQLAHEHGQCNPIATLAGQTVDALITGGIGGRALELLNAQRIRVYRAPHPVSAAQVLKDFREKSLEEITVSACCSHGPGQGHEHGDEHGHGHGCHSEGHA